MRATRYRDGARAIAPIAVAAVTFGVSFGVLAGSAGMDAVAATVMSATTFAGSAQFAVASILGASGGIAAAVLAATLLNARYAPISVSVAPLFEGGRVRRLLESQLIVDESWAVSRRPDGGFDHKLLVGAATVALKSVGPVLLGGRPLPEHLTGVVALLAPAVLAALVVTQVVGGDREIVLDARLVGLAAAVVALLLRAPLLVVVIAAAVATAAVRALS